MDKNIVVKYSLKRNEAGTLYDIVLRQSDGKWKLTGSVGGTCVCSDDTFFENEISEERVALLFEELRTTSVPALISHEHIVEEGFEEISIENGIFQSRFLWDENFPYEYATLQKIGKMLQGWV